jgi:hypothetical protein
MRVAERVLDEQLLTGQISSSTSSGSTTDGDTTYPWTMKSEPWSEDAMNQVTVRVSFIVQGNTYEVGASTLIDPAAGSNPAALSP